MQIGWIDFSKSERDKVASVIEGLRKKGVLDELGIAQIRDGFANLFFPGTTTIQTRAKYFLMVPYIFKYLESNSIKDSDKLKKELEDLEKECAIKLLGEDMSDDDEEEEDESGVIGKRSIRQGKWVKRPPSSIYWAGLKTYGIILHPSFSIDEYLNTVSIRKSLKENISKSGNSNDSSDEGRDDKGYGDIQSFNFWNIETYTKDWKENLKMDLTKEEGKFLKRQIIESCPDSMIAFILKNNRTDIFEYDSFSDLEDIAKFSDNLEYQFNLAKDFSDFNFVLRILFNVVASNGENKDADYYINNPKEWCGKSTLKEISEIDLEAIFTLLDIRDNSLRSFLLDCQELMEEEKIEELKDRIKKREISLKGENRSKTCNPDESGEKWFAGYELDYRFGVAKTIIEDIFKSEEYVEDENFDLVGES